MYVAERKPYSRRRGIQYIVEIGDRVQGPYGYTLAASIYQAALADYARDQQ